MHIIRASSAGFCFGVELAYNAAEKVLNEKKSHPQMVGPLVHNTAVVNELKEKGLSTVSAIEELKEGTAIIRAHGISNKAKKKVEARAGEVVDASCPFVVRLHVQASLLLRKGLPVIIIGDEDHPEMRAVVEDFPEVIVTRNAEDVRIKSIPSGRKVGLLIQTTEPATAFEVWKKTLTTMGYTVVARNTICSATTDRQEAVKQLAPKVDIMVVIGGRHSNNTKSLAELSNSFVRTIWVEDATELQKKDFIHIGTVGITAGASTPESSIAEVEARLRAFKGHVAAVV